MWLVYDHPAPRARRGVYASIFFEFDAQPNSSSRPLCGFAIFSSGVVWVHILEWISDWRQTRVTRALLLLHEHLASRSWPDWTCLLSIRSDGIRVILYDLHVRWCGIFVPRVDFTLVSERWPTQAKVAQQAGEEPELRAALVFRKESLAPGKRKRFPQPPSRAHPSRAWRSVRRRFRSPCESCRRRPFWDRLRPSADATC